MIEMPEAVTLASQMNTALAGKTIARFARGPLVHKFLWLNRPEEEYQAISSGRTITGASSFGRSVYLHLGQQALIWWGDFGGRILYHPPDQPLPSKFHLVWDFSDGSHLTYALQMWGGVRLLEASEFGDRPHAEAGVQPLSPEFTFERLDEMLDAYPEKTSKGVKGFLVATGYVTPNCINGLGNAYVQDILFRAGLDPRRKTPTLAADQRRKLYDAIQQIMQQAIALGGRDDERDLFDQPGRYVRLMDSRAVGVPCPACGAPIQKIAYLGGACYLCAHCQV
jgi:formamidopyrimidine-DNA glycosylase